MPIINKIEIDEKTAEPVIVQVSEKELKKQEKINLQKTYDKYDFI